MFIFKDKKYDCEFDLALSMFSRKWNSLVLYHLSSGTKRYGELKKLINNVTQKMLTQTLRELERYELISRKVYPVVPPKVEYSLTSKGKDMIPILEKIYEFGVNMYESYDKDGNIEKI
jgi:DNA-binding HxlR family transcriptional regulator